MKENILASAIEQQKWRELLLKEELANNKDEDYKIGNKIEKASIFRATKKKNGKKKS